MSNKQTAVDWLIKHLTPAISLQQKHIDAFWLQAKQMERDQILDAFESGVSSDCLLEQDSTLFAKEYYYETFKQQDNNE